MKIITKVITAVTLIASGVSTLSASESGAEELFVTNCASCHSPTGKVVDESKMLAPPIAGTIRHVKERYPNREDAIAFIVDYVQNPSKEKAICESKAIERFGLMPSLEGVISPEDFRKIANYAHDSYPNGKGRGAGKGQGKGYGKGQGKGQGRGQGKGRRQSEDQGQGQGNGRGQGNR